MMKRVVYEFLNTKYKGVLVYHQRFSLHDRITEKFVTDSYESIMEFTYYYSGKDRRYHLNNLLLSHVRRYILVISILLMLRYMFLNGVVIRVLRLLRCSNASYMEHLVLVLSLIRHVIII